jgi:hypothetical protein
MHARVKKVAKRVEELYGLANVLLWVVDFLLRIA